MTTPFDRLIGRRFATIEPNDPATIRSEELPILADMRALTESVHHNRDAFRALVPERRLSGLEPTIERGLEQAQAGNALLYSTVTKLLAAQSAYAETESAREPIRERLRNVVSEGLPALITADLTPRTRARALFDMALALSSVLATESGPDISESDRELLRRLYLQISAGIEHSSLSRTAEIAATEHSEIEAIPLYWSSYARAQAELLEGNTREALSNLLETQRFLREDAAARLRANPDWVSTGFREQVVRATEMAIHGMRGDTSALHAELLRSSTLLEALGYFYLVDEVEAHGEATLVQAQQNLQRFHLLAGLILHDEPTLGVSQILQRLSRIEGEAYDSLQETLRAHLEANPLSRSQREALQISSELTVSETVDELLRSGSAVATALFEARETAPIRSILERDSDHRNIAIAVTELRDHAELQAALLQTLGLAETTEPQAVVRTLLEYGNLMPAILNALPETIRENRDFENFFRQLRYASAGMENFPEHLNEILDMMVSLSETDETHAPAFAAFFRSMSHSESLAPGIALSPSFRARAERAARRLEEFSPYRILRHLTSPESIAMILGGSLLGEVGTGLLLRAGGTSGRLGWALREGQITLSGEIALGFGVGAITSGVSGAVHLAASPRPFGEELRRIGPGLAIGTLLSGFAIAGTSGLGRLLRGRRLPVEIPHVFGRLGTFTIGSGFMIGANYLTAGIVSGHWEAPNSEEIAETFAMMAAWDLAAAGWRGIGNRAWWRFQLGPRLSGELHERVGRLIERNPDLRDSRAYLENYYGFRLASGRGLGELSALLEDGRIPVLEGSGRARRLRSFTPEEFRIRAARSIRGVEDTAAYREVQSFLDPEHPLHIAYTEAHAQLRALAATVDTPMVYILIERSATGIENVSVHQRRPARINSRNILLRIGSRGLSSDEINRAVPDSASALRLALETLQSEIFARPAIEAPAGLVATGHRSESETTAGYPPAPPREISSERPRLPAVPPASSEAAPRAPETPGTPPAAPSPPRAPKPRRGSGREDTRRASADEMLRARRDSRELGSSTPDWVVDRDQFLLEMQRILVAHAEETRHVRAHLSRDGSVRLEVLESPPEAGSELNNTFVLEYGRITHEFKLHPNLRSVIDFYRSTLAPNGRGRPRRRSPVPESPRPVEAPARPSETESSRDEDSSLPSVRDEDVNFEDGELGSDGMPAADTHVSLEPPAIPREARAMPPPLPRASSPRVPEGAETATTGDAESVGRVTVEPPAPEGSRASGSEESAPILLTRERERIRSSSGLDDGTRTAGLRPIDSMRYAELSQRVLDLIDALESICRTRRPLPELFHITVSRNGEMRVINRGEYLEALRQGEEGVFILRRVRANDHSGSAPHHSFFLEGEPVLPDSHAGLGLEHYLPRWFGRNTDYEPRPGH